MIPKIIHYCWFGGNTKSQLIQNCIETWNFFLHDYEIIEWNESNFDINICPYVKEAFKQKKWAFVSDYVRAYALYNYGGVYLDTDVEITSTLNQFLNHKAFSGFEIKGFPFTALWATEKGHHWPKKVIDYYHKNKFSLKTNTVSITKLLIEDYGFNPNLDELQIYNDDIYIYPSNFFCVSIRNFAIHHFEGSWLKNNNELYKEYVLREFYLNKFKDTKPKFYDALGIIQSKYNISDLFLLRIILIKIFKKIFKK